MVCAEGNPLVDICCRREVRWITADIDLIWELVYTYIVHAHGSWEGQMLKIDGAEIPRHSQIRQDVLSLKSVTAV
jgi:hypothetical protein